MATNRTTRLVFDKDSRMVEVNGTDVALSFPLASDRGTLYIAQLDLNTTIRPLLFPPRFPDARRITTICLDPGHGGKDTGNRAPDFLPSRKNLHAGAGAGIAQTSFKRPGSTSS